MDRGRIATIVSIFAPIAIGLTVGLVAQHAGAPAGGRSAGTAATHAAAAALTASTAPKFVLLGCDNRAEVAPSGISNCVDGSVGLAGLRWTSWTPHLASGYGTYYLNDCRPTCAGGRLRTYPALVTLWGSAPVKDHPAERKYLQMTLTFTGDRPAAYRVAGGRTVVTHPVSLTRRTFP